MNDEEQEQAVFDDMSRRSAQLSAMAGLQENPDEAAQAIQLGRSTGTPPAVVAGDLESFKQGAMSTTASAIIGGNPHLQRFINGNPMASRVANDDYAQLDTVSQAVNKLPSIALAKASGSVLAKAIKGFNEGFGSLNERPFGSWALESQSGADFAEHHPLINKLVTFSPISIASEVSSRTFSGGLNAFHEAFTESLVQSGMDPYEAERASRDITAGAEMYMQGGHGLHVPEIAGVKGPELAKAVDPYIASGKEPPPGIHPFIDQIKAKQAALDVKNLDDALRESQSSTTRERSPEMFADYIRQHTEVKLSITADAVRKLYGDKEPAPEDNLLGWLPGIGDQLRAAEAAGGDIEIPLADWLGHVEPEVAKALREDIRVRPGGLTLNEAKELKEQKAGMVEPEPLKVQAEETEAQPKQPLVDAIDSVRQGAALEPLAQRLDRRKIELKKVDSTYSDHSFTFNDESGKELGDLDISEENGGKRLYVDDIRGRDEFGPRSFGPGIIRNLLEQLKQHFPDAETLTGFRVSGARDKANSFDSHGKVEIPLKGQAEYDHEAFQDIVKTGTRLDYGQGVEATVRDRELYTENQNKIVSAVNKVLERIVPEGVRFHEADEMAKGDKPVNGMYMQYKNIKPLIVWSMMGDDPIGTVRHEAIHHLRQYGFFTPEEWTVLRQAAIDNDWVKKHDIHIRYKGMGLAGMLEEAVADEFGDWQRNTGNIKELWKEVTGSTSTIEKVFKKLRDLLASVKSSIKDALGFEPSYQDLFAKVERGEIGSREGTKPLDPRAFAQAQQNEKGPAQLLAEKKWGELTEEEKAGMSREDKMERVREQNPSYVQVPIDVSIEDSKAYQEQQIEKSRTERIQRARRIDQMRNRALNTQAQQMELPETTRIEDRQIFEKASAIGMTVDQYKRYMKLIDKQKAEDFDAQTKANLAAIKQQQTAEWKANRTRVRGEVAQEFDTRPDIDADNFFRQGVLHGEKLDKRPKLADEFLTKEQKEALPENYHGEAGLHPDDAAKLFGFATGDELVDRLSALTKSRENSGLRPGLFHEKLINDETDRRMQDQYGDLGKNILNEATEHVLSQTQMDLLHEETLYYGMKAGADFPIEKGEIKKWVQERFGELPAAGHSTDKYLQAAGKAGRAAEIALLKGEYKDAFKAKQQQYMSMLMANEAKKLDKEMASFDKLADRFSSREVPDVDVEYTNFVHDILMRVGKPVKRSVQDLQEAIGHGLQDNLKDFVEYKQTHDMREVPIAPELFDQNFRKKFDDLTTDQFRAIHDSIKTLVKNGRDESRVYKDGAAVDLTDTLKEMKEQLQERPLKELHDLKRGGIMGKIKTYVANSITIESMLNLWDRNDPLGLFNQYVTRPLVEGSNYKAKLERRFAAEFRELGEVKDPKKLVKNDIFVDPLSVAPDNPAGTKFRFTRTNMLAILQNVGNPGNLKVLTEGYKVKPDHVMQWLFNNTTKEDWDRAQALGDLFGRIKKLSDVMYRDISGVASEAIELHEITTPFGTYKGWYHPLIKDSIREAEKGNVRGDPLEGSNYFRATTPAGYTKARTGATYPLDLSFDQLPSRINQMLHDIAYRQPVMQAAKIFYNKSFKNTVTARMGPEYADGLVPYLRAVANGANFNSKAASTAAQVSEYFRQNTIGTLVGLNTGTVFKHFFTALVNSTREVGLKDFSSAMSSLLSRDPVSGETNWRFSMDTSEELQRRSRNWRDTTVGANKEAISQSTLRETILEIGTTPVALSDLLSAVPTWLAAYNKAIETEDHGTSTYLADRAVRRAHGSTAITNLPAIARGGGLNSWISSLYGFFGNQLQRRVEIAWDMAKATRSIKAGEIGQGMKLVPKITGDVFAYVILPSLIEEAITSQLSDDHKGLIQRGAETIINGMASSFIGIRDLVHGVTSGHEPSVGLISAIMHDSANTYHDLARGRQMFNKEHMGNTIQHTVTFLGEMTGLVNESEGRALHYLYDVSTGQQRPRNTGDVIRGLRHGQQKVTSPVENAAFGQPRR